MIERRQQQILEAHRRWKRKRDGWDDVEEEEEEEEENNDDDRNDDGPYYDGAHRSCDLKENTNEIYEKQQPSSLAMIERKRKIISAHRQWLQQNNEQQERQQEIALDLEEKEAHTAANEEDVAVAVGRRQKRARISQLPHKQGADDNKKHNEQQQQPQRQQQKQRWQQNPFFAEARTLCTAEFEMLDRWRLQQKNKKDADEKNAELENIKSMVRREQEEEMQRLLVKQQQQQQQQQQPQVGPTQRETEMRTMMQLQAALLREQKRTLDLQRSLLLQQHQHQSSSSSSLSSSQASSRNSMNFSMTWLRGSTRRHCRVNISASIDY